MSSKISKILGVGLVVAVLASLLVAVAPASAGTLAWSSESITMPIDASADILDVAVAGNGTTVYAIGTGLTASNALVAKSTNGGTSWTAVTAPAGITAVTSIALAPDVADGSWVAIVVNGPAVYISADGGTTWAAAPAVTGATALNDIDISKVVGTGRTIAVAGTDGVGKLWTLEIGGLFGGSWVDTRTGTGWNSGNFTADVNAYAVAVSPNYIGDRTIALVTGNTTGGVRIQLANTNAQAWNMSVYLNWAQGVTLSSTVAGVTKAAMVVAPTYLGSDPNSRIAYVAVSGSNGGLYRAVDTTATALSAVPMNSVAVNTAGDKLVAGAAATNAVYRLASPATGSSLAVGVSGAYKSPGYAGPVSVGYAGTSVVAGTRGTEAAFAVSADDGKNFNDVSLINSTFAPVDFVVSADGSKVYVVSTNGGVVSLWKKTAAWTRIYCQANASPDFVVRIAPENSDVVYLAEKGTSSNSNVYYSNDGGTTTWLPRYSPVSIVDIDVESAAVVWATGADGATNQVSKSTDSGFTWDLTTAAKVLAFTPNMIDVIGANSVIVGGTAGGIAYTADGGTTWVTTVTAGTGAVQVTADKLTTGGVIYAASGTSVYRYTIGTSVASAPIKTGMVANATGIALGGTTLYVTTANTSDSYLYRSLTPAAAVPGWNTVGATANALQFVNTTRALFVSVGSDKNPKLWALNLPTSKSLQSFTDTLTLAGPALTGPANGTVIQINSANGQAVDVAFQWNAVTGATLYDMDISLDSAFTQIILPTTSATNLKVIGPNATGTIFQPDITYYWRVRVDPAGPMDSPYSATGNFKVGSLAPLKLLSPAQSATDVPILPTFSWTEAQGATTYQIFVSDDPTFAIITFSGSSDKPVYSPDPSNALIYSHTYYWRVRVSAPATAVTSYAYGVFTTQAEPTTTVPPITVTETQLTITQTVPPEVNVIPNYLLWIIIGIGAVLVIALIVLIVRTRRTS